MRYSASEKYEIIRLVESSSLSARQTLRRLEVLHDLADVSDPDLVSEV